MTCTYNLYPKSNNFFCIPITFYNPLKAFFRIRIYITIQTHPTQIKISIFLYENPVFSRFLKIIGVQS